MAQPGLRELHDDRDRGEDQPAGPEVRQLRQIPPEHRGLLTTEAGALVITQPGQHSSGGFWKRDNQNGMTRICELIVDCLKDIWLRTNCSFHRSQGVCVL